MARPQHRERSPERSRHRGSEVSQVPVPTDVLVPGVPSRSGSAQRERSAKLFDALLLEHKAHTNRPHHTAAFGSVTDFYLKRIYFAFSIGYFCRSYDNFIDIALKMCLYKLVILIVV